MSDYDGINLLRIHLAACAEELEVAHKKSSAMPNNPNKGTHRELALKHFLEQHLPSSCNVLMGGHIFDEKGNCSKQIDLIVAHDMALTFQGNGSAFVSIEGVICAISVKSNLHQNELNESISNLYSIPAMSRSTAHVDTNVITREVFYTVMPVRIIFAYTGFDKRNAEAGINKTLRAFESQNRLHYPSFIAVNKSWCASVYRFDEQGNVKQGVHTVTQDGIAETDESFAGAIILLRLLSDIHSALHIRRHLSIDFEPYSQRLVANYYKNLSAD